MTSGYPVLLTNDPYLHEIDLPCRAVHHPLGFRLNLTTNSRHVLEAAREAWGAYAPEFDREPLEIRAVVLPEGDLADSQPIFRGQGDLYSAVYDRDNFGVYDGNSLSGYCFVSEKTAADHLRLRIHFLEAMTYGLLTQRHAVPMHAAAVVRDGIGFILCGASGAGKSTLAFACARAGWTFVSDDATWLPVDVEGRVAIGRPSHARFREDAPRLFPELGQYAAEQRPNGKLTIEAPTADFHGVRSAVSCSADHLVLLERGARKPRLAPLPACEILERLLVDGPNYGERVREIHERTLGRLRDAKAWRLEYATLDEAIELMAKIA
jgi:hypothetical protein